VEVRAVANVLASAAEQEQDPKRPPDDALLESPEGSLLLKKYKVETKICSYFFSGLP
jgi:hypothetical protein